MMLGHASRTRLDVAADSGRVYTHPQNDLSYINLEASRTEGILIRYLFTSFLFSYYGSIGDLCVLFLLSFYYL